METETETVTGEEFTCSSCSSIFTKGRPDSEVMEEAERVFGEANKEGSWKLVCADCYPAFLPQGVRKCEGCPHDFDPHVVVATTGDPLQGGVMVCPEPECKCASTWAPEGTPRPAMPSQEELDKIREKIAASR
jgi:hypothetical protein